MDTLKVLIWVCTVCLGLFGTQLALEILEHLLIFFCLNALCPSQQFFSHVGTSNIYRNQFISERKLVLEI